MRAPNAETCKLLRDLKTEIGAAELRVTGSQADRAHNRAIEYACSIIDSYLDGGSIFQRNKDYAASTAVRFGWDRVSATTKDFV